MQDLVYPPHRLYHWYAYADNKTRILRTYVTDEFGDSVEVPTDIGTGIVIAALDEFRAIRNDIGRVYRPDNEWLE